MRQSAETKIERKVTFIQPSESYWEFPGEHQSQQGRFRLLNGIFNDKGYALSESLGSIEYSDVIRMSREANKSGRIGVPSLPLFYSGIKSLQNFPSAEEEVEEARNFISRATNISISFLTRISYLPTGKCRIFHNEGQATQKVLTLDKAIGESEYMDESTSCDFYQAIFETRDSPEEISGLLEWALEGRAFVRRNFETPLKICSAPVSIISHDKNLEGRSSRRGSFNIELSGLYLNPASHFGLNFTPTR